MAYVGWQFTRAALVNIPAIVLAIVSALLVFRHKVNSVWLVLAGAVAGILIRAAGL
jgi:chromate transporter